MTEKKNMTFWNLNLGGIEHRPPKLIMLVGVPGSGKTTVAKNIIKTSETSESPIIHISSDAIRGRIYGDENCQDNPNEVFRIMGEDTLWALNSGYDVVYDATNITRKNRASILSKLRGVRKECVVCWAPIETCVKRDSERSRSVGRAVIDKMLRRFEAPYFDEGFDEIHVVNTQEDSINCDEHFDSNTYYKEAIGAMDIPHDNPHHTYSVQEHCRAAGEYLAERGASDFLINSGFLHDIGKPYCKTFTNRRGEVTNIAHYYDHQAVGAWISYGFPGNSCTLAWLISTHMAPYINKKYYESLPPLWKRWIDELHRADLEAH